jgi:hypothetical protein
MLAHPIEMKRGSVLWFHTEASGQVAQLVEQRIENPRVGGSSPSLATIPLFLFLLLGCKDDPCEQLCQRTTSRLASCMEEWPVGWDDFDSTSRSNFRVRCDNRWDEVRSGLEPRELEDGRDQCSEGLAELTAAQARGEDCDLLRALYLR